MATTFHEMFGELRCELVVHIGGDINDGAGLLGHDNHIAIVIIVNNDDSHCGLGFLRVDYHLIIVIVIHDYHFASS